MSKNRSQARHHAVQALYQWQMTGQNIKDIHNQFLEEQDVKEFDVNYFETLLRGIPANLTGLDEILGPFLDRSIESVDPVERAILRLGTYELQNHLEVPYRVVINEGVELAKVFGAEQGHKYVNGVLDKIAHKLRSQEIKG
jgi:N utilization substance protein B